MSDLILKHAINSELCNQMFIRVTDKLSTMISRWGDMSNVPDYVNIEISELVEVKRLLKEHFIKNQWGIAN